MLQRFKKWVKGRLVREVRVERKTPVLVPVLASDLLKGRRALITGGSSGIGLAIADAFLDSGADVAITGRDGEKLRLAEERLCGRGRVDCVVLDNLDVGSFGEKLDACGAFDILVNNAGRVGGGRVGTLSAADYDLTMETNLRGPVFLSQAVARKWIAGNVRGNILNICSASSLRPGYSPYILSKWGLRALTAGMARQLVRYGIVVNGLAPGPTSTERFLHGVDDIGRRHIPAGRLVTEREVANLAVVMVSGLARMVVGDVLYVTGGCGVTTCDDAADGAEGYLAPLAPEALEGGTAADG